MPLAFYRGREFFSWEFGQSEADRLEEREVGEEGKVIFLF
jgi:hypothetical protein